MKTISKSGKGLISDLGLNPEVYTVVASLNGAELRDYGGWFVALKNGVPCGGTNVQAWSFGHFLKAAGIIEVYRIEFSGQARVSRLASAK